MKLTIELDYIYTRESCYDAAIEMDTLADAFRSLAKTKRSEKELTQVPEPLAQQIAYGAPDEPADVTPEQQQSLDDEAKRMARSEAAKKAAATRAANKAAKEETPADAGTPATSGSVPFATVRKAAGRVSELEGGRDKLIAVLAEFDAAKVSAIDESKYAGFVARCEELAGE